MLKQIATQFTDTILQQAASLYGAEPGDLTELEGFENYIYSFARKGQDLILRIGHTLHRSAPHTRAEIDWLNYLVDRGLPVARPVVSQGGRWLEVIAPSHDGGTSALGATGHLDFHYGVGSFHRHLRQAPRAAVIVRPGLAFDLDTVDDLDAVLRHPRGNWIEMLLAAIDSPT